MTGFLLLSLLLHLVDYFFDGQFLLDSNLVDEKNTTSVCISYQCQFQTYLDALRSTERTEYRRGPREAQQSVLAQRRLDRKYWHSFFVWEHPSAVGVACRSKKATCVITTSMGLHRHFVSPDEQNNMSRKDSQHELN